MRRFHPYSKTEPGSHHRDLPDIKPVPTGPKADRAGRVGLWARQRGYVSECSKEDSTAELRGRRKHSQGNSMRRASPVADRRSVNRQNYSSPTRVKPRDSKVKIEEAETEAPNVAFPLLEIERRPRDRSESQGLFVHQNAPEPYPDNQSDPASEYGSETDVSAYGDVVEGDPPRDLLAPDEEDRRGPCICPINLQCPRKANNLIDCRKLVPDSPDWTRWNAITQPLVNALLNAIVPPVDADFATAERINRMHHHCGRVEGRPAGHDADRGDYREMVKWAVEMQSKSVNQARLDDTQILPRLQSFLAPVNPAHHLLKRTPLNLLEELTVIFRKWSRGDFLVDANRGLLQISGVNVAGRPYTRFRIDKQWRHRKHDSFYGHGHLINGQRWPQRIHLSRDGGHGPHEAGIAGSIHDGARSIVMGSHDKYADVDMGDRIYYYGTALPKLNIPNDPEPAESNIKDTAASSNRGNREETHGTKCLRRSMETGVPVRVFRSYKLNSLVRHKPITGFRYDGLYRVTRAKLHKKDRQIVQFTMHRLRQNDPASGGQGPLRGVRGA